MNGKVAGAVQGLRGWGDTDLKTHEEELISMSSACLSQVAECD